MEKIFETLAELVKPYEVKTTSKNYAGKNYTAYFSINDLLLESKDSIIKEVQNAKTGDLMFKLSSGNFIMRKVDADSNFVFIIV